jgi:hypothetical protein
MNAAGPDLAYVEARRVLLDALDLLAPHRDALVLAGAQAIYLRAGPDSLPVSDHTTDSDLALDPDLLLDEPALEELMRRSGFELVPMQGSPEPGIWAVPVTIGSTSAVVSVDLLVPARVAPRKGRGALGPPHGKRAARRISGLEPALVDSSEMTVTALHPADRRSHRVRVASVPALLVAKIHKLSDRIAAGRKHRVDDKDAVDVVRLMLAEQASAVAGALSELRNHPAAGEVTREAITRFDELFGSRAGAGIEMAARGLRVGMPEERVRAICLDYAEMLRAQLAHR